ncbi:MAG TPA: DUF2271 domain-containing protein [Hyphomonadaceae bacterium]|jgi:hypothetical protein|nr:DUF2271 domain-containing protein [Hyphomonadaceae bacterium]HPN05517.1 DUF2271 domain-containing protein [Hyphomonadaceae bacterium]
MRKLLTLAVPVVAAGAAHAGTLEISVEIPKLTVSEYHRPYIAIWIEDASGKVAANLNVWYATKLDNDEGEKWLKDIRQWWRRTGRGLDLPIDGVSSPTKPPGKNVVKFDTSSGPIASLAPGDYKIIVEASREVGGKELVELPFKWAPGADATGSASGKEELGAISFKLTK